MSQNVNRSLSEIDKELKSIEKDSRTAAKEAKNLSNALNINPKNTKLQADYQQVVSNQISITTSKLDALKRKQEEFDRLSRTGASVSKAEYEKLQRQIDLTEESMSRLTESQKRGTESLRMRFSEGIGKATSGLKELVAIAVVAVGTMRKLYGVAESAAEAGQQIYSVMQKYGGTAEDIQRMGYAFEKITGDASSYSRVLRQVQEQMALASKNTNQTVVALQNLGIGVDDIKGMNVDQVLALIMERLRGVTDEATRTTYAVALLHDSGSDLAAVLNSGDFQKYYNGLDRTSIITSKEAENAKILSDQLSMLEKQRKKISVTIGTALLPMIQALSDMLVNLSPIIAFFARGLENMGKTGQTIMICVTGVLAMLPALAAGLRLINAILNASPVFAIVSAVSALVGMVVFLIAAISGSKDDTYKKLHETADYTNSLVSQINSNVNNTYNSSNITNNSSNITNNSYNISGINQSDTLADISLKLRQAY